MLVLLTFTLIVGLGSLTEAFKSEALKQVIFVMFPIVLVGSVIGAVLQYRYRTRVLPLNCDPKSIGDIVVKVGQRSRLSWTGFKLSLSWPKYCARCLDPDPGGACLLPMQWWQGRSDYSVTWQIPICLRCAEKHPFFGNDPANFVFGKAEEGSFRFVFENPTYASKFLSANLLNGDLSAGYECSKCRASISVGEDSCKACGMPQPPKPISG